MITDDDYQNPWIYRGHRFTLPDEELEKYAGFVYVIQALAPGIEGKMYVGQKLLWGKKTTQKTDRRTKITKYKKVRTPSDWKRYYGSSEELKADVLQHGPEKFTREIIHLCERKGDMNYLEMKEQMDRGVMLRDDSYNSFIGGRINRRHISPFLRSKLQCHSNTTSTHTSETMEPPTT